MRKFIIPITFEVDDHNNELVLDEEKLEILGKIAGNAITTMFEKLLSGEIPIDDMVAYNGMVQEEVTFIQLAARNLP